ncbi:alpha/beta hydrolase [Blastococcus sp. TML/M2B]|uniref:alpha/beta fold hydrolase n=1 Tax=unclassified Blastococcus TaxID=2619396 RepID=UPI00190C8FCC|nr:MULTISPECIES: alpha/beta hydrolase [unclassified Blastococcus]MBN1093688.1 alpha/beta hydrolase [Blastococcus sp. TML/M2B]MBN1096193.1 alpha/beta hydrolase [Blastococcus sp. TML/C7B]
MESSGTTSGIEKVTVGDVELAYETFGDRSATPVLLISGLGSQMISYADEFCADLAARGTFVVRFDNRDVGLSTHLHEAGPPDLGAIRRGDRSGVAYDLADMAADAAGLITALGLESVHVVGVSMGGMIAQRVAFTYPERVRSLTSIMSTTGDRSVGGASEAATAVLYAPPATDRETAIARQLETSRVIGSPGFPLDEEAVSARAALAFDRAHDPAGVARQMAAIFSSPDRTPDLARVAVPTLVIHGSDDALVNVSGGRATAAAVPGAELVVLEGMGHDLPRPLWPEIIERIAKLVASVEGLA